jgi:RNA polymerase sigma-B factor
MSVVVRAWIAPNALDGQTPQHVESFMVSAVTTPAAPPARATVPTASPTDDVDAFVADQLATMSTLDANDPDRDRLRSEVICACLPMVRRAAARFAGRGENLEDLIQVGTVGLIKAVDRFDPSRETPFVNYAMPTILGEVKRHFRDKSWSVRVSRARQELYLEISRLIPTMAQELGRSPSVSDISGRLGIPESEVLAGIDCGQAHTARSLSTPVGDDDGAVLSDVLGAPDERLESVADRQALHEALADVPVRERNILMLRFFANMTQSEIAERVGVSQMHVSRLLTRTLADLRTRLLVEE